MSYAISETATNAPRPLWQEVSDPDRGSSAEDLSRPLARFRVFRYASPLAGVAMRWFSYVYFAVMVLRYTLIMTFYPEGRWFGGTIPTFFHWVLAAYLFILS